MFSDGSIFCVVGTVMCGPLWSQGRNGRQTLEGRVCVRTAGANGSQREDVVQFRVWRGDLQAQARLLVPGARIMVTGGVGGRLWQGDRGEKVFTDLSADRVIPLEDAPRPMITDSDLQFAPPPQPPPVQAQAAPQAQAQNMSDVPF